MNEYSSRPGSGHRKKILFERLSEQHGDLMHLIITYSAGDEVAQKRLKILRGEIEKTRSELDTITKEQS